MLGPLANTINGVIETTWPMVVISIVIIVTLRISYILKNKEKIVLYKELINLSFITYVLCLFQIVTFQETATWTTNNFTPFNEILRYELGSRLFIKNIIGNILMFLPFGIFVSFYLKSKKIYIPLILTIIASSSIEVVQLIIGRVFDIDDIILNVSGGIIGFILYYVFVKIANKLPRVFKSDHFLNVLAVIVITLIIIWVI